MAQSPDQGAQPHYENPPLAQVLLSYQRREINYYAARAGIQRALREYRERAFDGELNVWVLRCLRCGERFVTAVYPLAHREVCSDLCHEWELTKNLGAYQTRVEENAQLITLILSELEAGTWNGHLAAFAQFLGRILPEWNQVWAETHPKL